MLPNFIYVCMCFLFLCVRVLEDVLPSKECYQISFMYVSSGDNTIQNDTEWYSMIQWSYGPKSQQSDSLHTGYIKTTNQG